MDTSSHRTFRFFLRLLIINVKPAGQSVSVAGRTLTRSYAPHHTNHTDHTDHSANRVNKGYKVTSRTTSLSMSDSLSTSSASLAELATPSQLPATEATRRGMGRQVGEARATQGREKVTRRRCDFLAGRLQPPRGSSSPTSLSVHPTGSELFPGSGRKRRRPFAWLTAGKETQLRSQVNN